MKRYVITTDKRFLPQGFPDQPLITPLVSVRTTDGSVDYAHIVATARQEGSQKSFPIAVINSDGRKEFFFDIDASLDAIRFERYQGSSLKDSITTYLPFDYTKLPMPLIGIAYRLLSHPLDLEAMPKFPAYPLDISGDLLAFWADRAFGGWPDKKNYAILLTHDVDTAWGLETAEGEKWLESYLAAEEECGFRSAWYCVPTSVRWSQRAGKNLEALSKRGHEIGIHGFSHDANITRSALARLEELFSAAKKIMAPYGSEFGYRAPWLSRNTAMYQALSHCGYLYDTSVPNSDVQRNNPLANNGCCTLFPFKRENMVVLPITLPQDSMRLSLNMSASQFWEWIFERIQLIREMGGVAVISTHIQPHHSANEPMLAGYRTLLARLSAERTAWRTLPREAALWAQARL